MLHVTQLRIVRPGVLWLRFDDGAEGEVDLSGEFEGPVFGPLRDPSVFGAAVLDPELRTVTWPTGADFAPEFLRAKLTGRAAA